MKALFSVQRPYRCRRYLTVQGDRHGWASADFNFLVFAKRCHARNYALMHLGAEARDAFVVRHLVH